MTARFQPQLYDYYTLLKGSSCPSSVFAEAGIGDGSMTSVVNPHEIAVGTLEV